MRTDEIKRLKEQRLTLVQELRSHNEAMRERAEENGGEYAAEDEAEFERREKDLLALNKRIETEFRTESLVAYVPENAVAFPPEGGPTTLEEYRSALTPGRLGDSPEYRKALYSYVVNGRDGLEQDEYRVLSKAANGGAFLVPTDLAQEVVRALRFLPGGVGVLARTVTTSTGDTFNVPQNLTHGTAAWIAESGSYTPSDEVMTNKAMSAYKAGTKIIVSEELLTDSAFDLSSFLATEFGERIGALAENAYINGNGTGQPSGLLDASAALTVYTLPTGQVTTLTAAAILTAAFQVPPQYREGMSILVADSLWVRLLTLVDSTGRPLWQPSLASGAPDTLSGIPIYTHPNLPASGANAKSMIVGNFNRCYWIRRVDGIYMQRQNELHSDSGQVGFRAYLRLDGQAVLPDAARIVAFAAT